MALFGYGAPRPKFGAGFDPSQHIGIPTQAPLQQPLAAPQQAPQPEPGFWQGGGKFRTRDGLAGALAVLSDVFNNQAGNPGGAVQNLAGGRLSALDLARKQQEAQQQRMQERDDYVWKAGIDQQYREPKAPYRWEANDGSLMEMGPDGQTRVAYKDPNQPLVVGADGRYYPKPLTQVPTAPVGKLTPLGASIQNTPAPALGTNGVPPALTRAQYQAIVNAKGQAATDDYIRRHNIQVGN